jgi:hypothetical protein
MVQVVECLPSKHPPKKYTKQKKGNKKHENAAHEARISLMGLGFELKTSHLQSRHSSPFAPAILEIASQELFA